MSEEYYVGVPVSKRGLISLTSVAVALAVAGALSVHLAPQQSKLAVSVDAHGNYVLGESGSPALISGVAAKIDGAWVRSADYPKHAIKQETVEGYAGTAEQWTVSFS